MNVFTVCVFWVMGLAAPAISHLDQRGARRPGNRPSPFPVDSATSIAGPSEVF